VMMFVIFPLAIIPMGVALLTGGGSILTIVGGIFSILILLISLTVVGWAVFYFYRRNVFIYKKR
jgi:hypothetical protein